MHRDAAGIATDAPTINREADLQVSNDEQRRHKKNLQISHQTGAGLKALPCHTIELINKFRQDTAVQSI